MEQYQHLVRKRNRALGLFARVAAKLSKLEAKISDAIVASIARKQDAYDTVKEEIAASTYLTEELAKTQQHRRKVEELANA